MRIYGEMQIDETKNYQLFKERVTERYGLTPEHSRRELRMLKKNLLVSWAVDWTDYYIDG